jgi:hypothetical protein
MAAAGLPRYEVGIRPARDAKGPHERLQANSNAGEVSCDTTFERQAKGLLYKEVPNPANYCVTLICAATLLLPPTVTTTFCKPSGVLAGTAKLTWVSPTSP